MSNEAFTREDITLQDGTEVELRPLVISKKRKFMDIWAKHVSSVQDQIREATEKAEADSAFRFDESGINNATYDVYLKMCAIGLSEIKEDRTDKVFITYLEDVLDEPTIFKIIKVCGNIDLEEDPNSPN